VNQNSPDSLSSNMNITFYDIVSSQNPFTNPEACTRLESQPGFLSDKCDFWWIWGGMPQPEMQTVGEPFASKHTDASKWPWAYQ
jgi:hypothetical protein